VAAGAAPNISTMLSRLFAISAHNDPNSLLNRPPRIVVLGVTGAPGDGNFSLAHQMVFALGQSGALVVDNKSDADVWVRAEIKTANTPPNNERVEVQWIVEEPRGERGRVVQVNEVPRGSLDGYWGEVAQVVATQAATGVRRVIETSSGGGPLPDVPEGSVVSPPSVPAATK
jgi:hypothetical protein